MIALLLYVIFLLNLSSKRPNLCIKHMIPVIIDKMVQDFIYRLASRAIYPQY
jgi:hypothetical protein